MPFEIPVASFNATEFATNKILRANQLQETILTQFKASYEDFWGVTPDGGSRHTTAEMQSILNVMGGTAIEILTAAAGLVQFLDAAYPDVLDQKYRGAAFDYTIGQFGLTLTGLNSAWAVPVPPEEE
jgi:hypothetical protein